MMHTFVFFIADFVAAAFFNDWLIHILLGHFISLQLTPTKHERFFSNLLWPFGLLLLQDTHLYGRFGLGLMYLVPTLVISRWLNTLFASTVRVVPYLVFIAALLAQHYLEGMLVVGKRYSWESTVYVIMINVVVLFFYRFFMGTRGNRTISS